jgi:hypothetical protein
MTGFFWHVLAVMGCLYFGCCTSNSTRPKACQLIHNESISAYERARTPQCKQEIVEKACELQSGDLFDEKHEGRQCPRRLISRVACIKNKLLKEFNRKLASGKFRFFVEADMRSENECVQHCFTYGHKYSVFNQTDATCKCFFNISKNALMSYFDEKCDRGSTTFQLYDTGVKGLIKAAY